MNEEDTPMGVVRSKVKEFVSGGRKAIDLAKGTPFEDVMETTATASITHILEVLQNAEKLIQNRRNYPSPENFSSAFAEMMGRMEDEAVAAQLRAEGMALAQKAISEFLVHAVRFGENGMAATDEDGNPIPFSFSAE